MTPASDDNDTRAEPIDMLDKFRPVMAWIAAVLGATRTSLQKVEVAHASRCNRASFSAEEFQDTAIDPSDATGIAAWQPDLPFFMQSGFGQR